MKKITDIIKKAVIGMLCLSAVALVACSDTASTATHTGAQSADASAPARTDAQTEEIKEEGDGVVTVIAAGDNLVHESVYKDAAARARRVNVQTKGYYFDSMYDPIKDIVQAADLAIINQESQICGEGYEASGYPSFCTPVDMGTALMNVGFNAIVTANNHMLDMGDEGLLGTVNYWKDKPVIQVGIDLSEEEGDDIAVFEQEGIKIALLAYTDVLNVSASKSDYAGYTYYNFRTASRQVEKAKQVADIVIVSIHWGEENTFELTSSQKDIASQLARLGVDVILGHHPHVVQSVEWIQANNGNRSLCVYSLGNFLSNMSGSYNTVGMMLQFDVVKNDSSVSIQNVQVIPTITYYTASRSGYCVYPLKTFSKRLAVSHGCNAPASYDAFCSYITDNISEEFLTDYLK